MNYHWFVEENVFMFIECVFYRLYFQTETILCCYCKESEMCFKHLIFNVLLFRRFKEFTFTTDCKHSTERYVLSPIKRMRKKSNADIIATHFKMY